MEHGAASPQLCGETQKPITPVAAPEQGQPIGDTRRGSWGTLCHGGRRSRVGRCRRRSHRTEGWPQPAHSIASTIIIPILQF